MYTLNITVHLYYILITYLSLLYHILCVIGVTVYNVALDSDTQTITRIFCP